MLQFISHYTEQYSYLDSIRLALEGGCRWIQLRMKDASDEEVRPIAFEALHLCRNVGATFIIKGVRSVKDFEYEREQADINRQLTGIDTLFLFADPSMASISSSMVRELRHFGKDVSKYIAKIKE
jgi:pantetheine-phosphate adenylyltransferase